MIGIIGAMDEEVAKLKEKMDDVKVETIAAMDFYEGNLKGHPVVVVRSGIGKVNAGMCTQILALKYNVDAIINTGIAGSLDADIDIGDIVLSTDTLEHDMDAVAFGYPVGQVPRMDTLSFVADEKLRNIAREVCNEVNPDQPLLHADRAGERLRVDENQAGPAVPVRVHRSCARCGKPGRGDDG